MQTFLKIVILLGFSLAVKLVYSASNGCSIQLIVQSEKEWYAAGDTVTVLVKVILRDDVCDEAAEVTKIFAKGMKIVNRSHWRKLSGNTVGQKLVLLVQNEMKQATLTVFRKTAHYDCFMQKEFKLATS